MRNISFPEAVDFLKQGKIGVIPTDTLYGIVASALFPESVERVYRVRGRSERKPCILLIADISDMERFGVRISIEEKEKIETFWPGKVSLIFSGISKNFSYLHRGTNTLAFRIPNVSKLREFLRLTGPIIAPSANLEGKRPAETVEKIREYFGEEADFFVDGGKILSQPSTIIKLEGMKIIVVREGAVVFPSA